MKELSIEEIRRIQLDILKNVSEYCKQHGIQYILTYGTLLGAIRHKGYIPWDDDIDIAMPRPDYERFIHNYYSNDCSVAFFEKDNRYPYTYAKVYRKGTYILEKSARKFQLGINIDVFPIDGLPSDIKHLKKHYFVIQRMDNILQVKNMLYSKERSIFRNMLLYLLKACFSIISYKYIQKQLIKQMKIIDYNNSFYCSNLNFGNYTRSIPKEVLSSTVDVCFEDDIFSAPIGYDYYLKSLYGDYMQLPPIEKRKSHHKFKAYLC